MKKHSNGRLMRVISALLTLCMVVGVMPGVTLPAKAATETLVYDFTVANDSASFTTDYVKSITYDTVANSTTGISEPWAFLSFTPGSSARNNYFTYVSAGTGLYFSNAARNITTSAALKFKVSTAGKYVPMLVTGSGQDWTSAGYAEFSINTVANNAVGDVLSAKGLNQTSYWSDHVVALSDTPIEFSANTEYALSIKAERVMGRFHFNKLLLVPAESAIATDIVLDGNSGLVKLNADETATIPVEVTMSDGSAADLSDLTFEYSQLDVISAKVVGNNVVITPNEMVGSDKVTLTVKHGEVMARTNVTISTAGTVEAGRDLYYNFQKSMPSDVQSEVNHYYSKTFIMANSTTGAYGEAKNDTYSPSDPWGIVNCTDRQGNIMPNFYFSRLYQGYGFLHADNGTATIKFRVPVDGMYMPAINLHSVPATAATLSIWKEGESSYISAAVIDANSAVGENNISAKNIKLEAGDYLLRFNKTSSGSIIYNGFSLDYKGPITNESIVEFTANGSYTAVEGNAPSNVSLNLTKDGTNVSLTDEKVTAFTATVKDATVASATVNADRTIAVTPIKAGVTSIDVAITFDGKNYTATIPVTVKESVVSLKVSKYTGVLGTPSNVAFTLDKDGVAIPLTDAKVTSVTATSTDESVVTVKVNADNTVTATPVKVGGAYITIALKYDGVDFSQTVEADIVAPEAGVEFTYDFTVLAKASGTVDYTKSITYDQVLATGKSAPWAFHEFAPGSDSSNNYFIYVYADRGFYIANAARNTTTTGALKFKTSKTGKYIPMLVMGGGANWAEAGFAMFSIETLTDGVKGDEIAHRGINFTTAGIEGHAIPLSTTPVDFTAGGEYTLSFKMDKIKGRGQFMALKLVPVEGDVASEIVLDHNSGLVNVNMGETATIPVDVTMTSGNPDLSKLSFEYSVSDIATAEVSGNAIKITPKAVGKTMLTVKYGEAMARTYIDVKAADTKVEGTDLYYNFQAGMPSNVETEVNHPYSATFTMATSTAGAYGEGYNTNQKSAPWGIVSRVDTSGNEKENFYFSRLYQGYGFLHGDTGTVTMRIRVPVDGMYNPLVNLHSNPACAETVSIWKTGADQYLCAGVLDQQMTSGPNEISDMYIPMEAGDYFVKFNKTASGSVIMNGLTLEYKGPISGEDQIVLKNGGAYSAIAGATPVDYKVELRKNGDIVNLTDSLVTAFTATSGNSAVATATVNSDRSIKIKPVAKGETTISVVVTYNGKDYTTSIPVSVSEASNKTEFKFDFLKLVLSSKTFQSFASLNDYAMTTMGSPKEVFPTTKYCSYTDPFIFGGIGGDNTTFDVVDCTYAAMLRGGVGSYATVKVRISAPGTYDFSSRVGCWNAASIVDFYIAPDGVADTVQPQYYVGTIDPYKAVYEVSDWTTMMHVRNVTITNPGDYQVTFRIKDKKAGVTAYNFAISGLFFTPITADEAIISIDDSVNRVMVNETKSADLAIAVNNVPCDFTVANDLKVKVDDESVLTATIEKSGDGKTAKISYTGVNAGKTNVNVIATVNGKTVSATKQIIVNAPQDTASEILIDFTKGQGTPILDKTVATDGWAINKQMTNVAIYNPTNKKHFRYQAYGIGAYYQGNRNTEYSSDVTFDVDVLAESAYELRIDGGRYKNAANVAVYVDKQYVGEYNFSGEPEVVSQGEKQLNTVKLGVGVHQITFRNISNTDYLTIGKIRLTPVSEMPTFQGFVAEAEQTTLTIGEKASAVIGPKMSDGSPYYFGNLFEENAADTQNSYKFTNSDGSVVSYENGIITGLKAGTSKLSVAGVKDGVATNKDITITVQNDPLVSVDANIKETINNGEKSRINVTAKTASGRVINPLSYDATFASSNTGAILVRDGIMTGVGKGSADITITVTLNGVTKSVTKSVSIANDGIKLYAYADDTTIKIDQTSQVRVANSSMEPITSGMTYKSSNEKVLKVDASGKVTPISLGKATVDISTNYRGTNYNLSVEFKVTEDKNAATYYTGERIAALRENRQKYDWAVDTSVASIKAADNLINIIGTDPNNYLHYITTQELPRAASPSYRWDPNAAVCRYCGLNLANTSWGSYGWLIDPINKEWKITCPDCRKSFPTNDFGKFYELGIGDDGMWDYELAKAENAKLVAAGHKGYLVNETLPEKGEGWGVEDGWGYRTGKTLTNTQGNSQEEVYTWIAYYNHYGIWQEQANAGPYSGIVHRALNAMNEAYINTGDMKYGKIGAIMVDRIADIYPTMYTGDSFPLFANSDSTLPKGKMVGCIWQHGESRMYMLGYDAYYEVYEDPTVIEFINNNALKYDAGIDKSSAVAIREHIEEHLVHQTYKDMRNGNIHGNFGMHQSLAAYTGVIYDTMPKTKEILDWMYASTTTSFGSDEILGGNVNAQIINLVDRDGLGAESGANYNVLWANSILNIFGPTEGYTRYEAKNGFNNPRVIKMFKAYLPLTLARRTTVQIGDSGATAKRGFQMTDALLAKGFQNSGDVEMAQFLYHMYNGDITQLHADKYTRNPEAIQQQVLDIIKEHGEYNFDQSHLLAGYGFAILRDGTYRKAANSVNDVDTQRDVWMYFGAANSHKHSDIMNLGMEAFGVSVLPDLGYPTNADGSDRTVSWEMGTMIHNTVMVNETNLNRIRSYNNGVARNGCHPYHYDDSDRVKLIDVAACKDATPAKGDFRRSVVYVKVDEENSYAVDFFRVTAGTTHTYGFHALSNTIHATEGLTLTAQNGGTYAGADVAFGTTGIGKGGAAYLYNVRTSPCASGNFAVDFKIQNFRGERWYKNNIHLRVTMLNDFKLDDVSIAKGKPPIRDDNPTELEFVYARRRGTNLDSLFTAVYEPYDSARYIAEIKSVPVTYANGGALSAADLAQTKAVKVTRTDGVVDYIVYSTNTNTLFKVDNTFEFKGFACVYTLKDGKLVYSYGQDAGKVGENTSLNAYTGKIVDFTKELSRQNFVTIQFDQQIEANRVIGKMLDVANGRNDNGNVIILGVDDLGGNKYCLDIGEASMVTSMADPADEKAGYIYNMGVGQDVRIPLPTISSTGPKFDKIEDFSTEVGAEVKFTVNAKGDEGKTLTYEMTQSPSGATFDAETRTFEWVPQSSHRGDNVIAFKVSDGIFTDTLYLTITVFGS
ncbi:MAG: heparinase II/III family protein, partial [Clostridia bacterium]|nr:heparinase II/III family protein [Clostridia bacterium]